MQKNWFFNKSEDEKIECYFTSLRKQGELARLLNINPILDSNTKIDYISFFADENNPVKALQIILANEVTNAVLDEWSAEEVIRLITTFFVRAGVWMMQDNTIDSKLLTSIIKEMVALNHPVATPSMSQSTMLH